MPSPPKIAIAGASGFVGRALAESLSREAFVIGLSRNAPSRPGEGCKEWRKADFLSLLEAEKALEGVETAFYLIHSMMPSAHLTQGRFQDFDLIAADNFARSAKANGVKQIIYLGGLIPENEELSAHLSSRLEVGEALAAYGTPVTTLRAGMVIGRDGSSFVMVRRLVERLPVMLCPHWTRVKTQPIALRDIVGLLRFCAGNEKTFGESYDVGGPDVLTYEEMMREIGEAIGRHPILFRSPFLRQSYHACGFLWSRERPRHFA
ncbi:MAG: NAD-dependent epimerase/dehydratase family protein [Bdellovibrionota bacterium]